jgi:hypothetical protein
METIQITYYTNFNEVSSLWDAIFQRTSKSYFFSTDWHNVVKEFYKNTVITKATTSLIYFSAKENEVNSVVGFFYVTNLLGKKTLKFTHLLGPSDYYDFIYSNNVSEDFIEKIMYQIVKDMQVSEISFSNVKSDAKLFLVLKKQPTFQLQPLDCVNIHLKSSFEEYLNGLSKNVKQNLRTANNRIAKNNIDKEITFFTQKEAHLIDFKELKNIYKRRSSHKKKSVTLKSKIYAFLDDPFQKEMDMFDLKSIKTTDFVLGILKLDHEIGAYFFGLKTEKGIEINRVAINDAFKFYSPGMVLLSEFIKNCIDEEYEYLDLTVGDEKYKYDLGGTTHQIYNCTGKL